MDLTEDQANAAIIYFFQSKQYEEAERLALLVTKQFPTSQFGWKALGAVLKNLGKPHEALVAYKRAIKLSPRDEEAHSNLGVLQQELGKLSAAATSLKKAISIKPNYPEAHYNLGGILKELGNFEEAEKML